MSLAPQEGMRPKRKMLRAGQSGKASGPCWPAGTGQENVHVERPWLHRQAAEYGVDKMKDKNKEKPMVEENTKEEKKKM